MSRRSLMWTNYPFGCRYCECPADSHGQQYITEIGVHGWVRPTDRQIFSRMLRRRAHPANRWRTR